MLLWHVTVWSCFHYQTGNLYRAGRRDENPEQILVRDRKTAENLIFNALFS